MGLRSRSKIPGIVTNYLRPRTFGVRELAPAFPPALDRNKRGKWRFYVAMKMRRQCTSQIGQGRTESESRSKLPHSKKKALRPHRSAQGLFQMVFKITP